MRDRDYLLDRRGVIFKVIGDVHPDGHYLRYVKYHPDERGDRRLFGQTYRQNTVVSKSFGILADRPECYVYSPVLGCVITGLPRQDIATHYSCRQALTAIHRNPGRVQGARAGRDLLAIIARIIEAGVADLFGVTGSLLAGCFTERSDIDLVCYGETGYQAACELFACPDLIRHYAGDDVMQLYLRRARYMAGGSFDALIRQEQRKLQGLTARVGAHINSEPLRSDEDSTFTRMYAKESGDTALRSRHAYWMIRVHVGRAAARSMGGSIRGWGARHAFMDYLASRPDCAPGRLQAHVITAMYSSADERAFSGRCVRRGACDGAVLISR